MEMVDLSRARFRKAKTCMQTQASLMQEKDLLKKTPETYNKYYKAYRAAYCHSTGLPMYGHKDFPEVQEKRLYTKTRAKREKVQIDESQPVGWYRMPNGYTPMFRAV